MSLSGEFKEDKKCKLTVVGLYMPKYGYYQNILKMEEIS